MVFSADFSSPEISLCKKEKATEKIDGAAQMITAPHRAIRCGCVSEESVYDSREMLIL